MINQYKVKTTKILIHTWARDEETAIHLVMEAECCPRRAILSVEKVTPTIANHGGKA